jgi:hypothetical protein
MTASTAAGSSTEQLVERLFGGVLGLIDVQMTYLGDRLGLYRALAGRDATATELASATACDPRYVREWLEQQAVAGILAVDDVTLAPDPAAIACRRLPSRSSPTVTASATSRRWRG